MFLIGITKEGCIFFITDTICQSSALSLPRETKKLIKNGILRIFLFSFGKRRGR